MLDEQESSLRQVLNLCDHKSSLRAPGTRGQARVATAHAQWQGDAACTGLQVLEAALEIGRAARLGERRGSCVRACITKQRDAMLASVDTIE